VALVVMTTGALGIAKKELVYIPFFGIAAWAGGVLFFDRKNKASRAQILVDAVARLKAGASYHVFPEGTRTRTGKLAEKVHLKLVERCWEEKIPVLPACAWNTEQTLPAERIWAWPGHSAGLELQKLMQPADWSSAKDFSEAAWEKVVKMAQAHGADQAIVK
jgi:1-acyl-sn-glycerol-3-phosphate acyltransferase